MGGLLGLFMGFSVFSIIEVLYFLSIRPYCNYLKNAENRRRSFSKLFGKFRKPKFGTESTTSINHSAIVNNVIFPHVN